MFFQPKITSSIIQHLLSLAQSIGTKIHHCNLMPALYLPLRAHHSSRQIFVCWNVVITVVERWIVGDGLRQLKIDQASA
jgi:hypothetical protein